MKNLVSSKAIMFLMVVALCVSTITVMPVDAAGAIYYVDAANGNDNNSGTSANLAWKTLNKVNSMTFSPGDKILLKAGCVWYDQYLDLKGSGTSTNPIIVDMYGTGNKPLINFGNTAVSNEGFGVRLKNVSYWEVNNLEITSGQYSTDRRRSGVLVVGEGSDAGNFQHIYIKNIFVHDVFGTDRRTGGINFYARGANTDKESTWDDILVEGCTIINVADTGIQTMTNAFSNSSWVHKTDAFRNVKIRNNYVEKIHRDGILVRAGVSPLVEYNTTNKIGTSCEVDTSIVNYLDTIAVVAAQWAYSSTGAVFQYNEAFDTKKIDADGQPWDFDVDVYDSVYQYNYSHNNQGGTLLTMNGTDGNIFRYNISQNDLDMMGVFSFPTNNGEGAKDLYVYNNVFYRTVGSGGYLTKPSPSGIAYFYNNIFYNGINASYQTGSKIVYDSNCYYGANSNVPSDAHKVVGDPKFVNPGVASSRATADGYKLYADSPCINKGKIISDNGGKDYFGNSLYYGAPDIGAHEYTSDSPTPTPTPPPVTLLECDFEDNNTTDWTTNGGTWNVVTDGSQVYSQSSTAGAAIAYAGDSSWTNYSYEAKVKVVSANGNAGILFRYTDASNYYMFRLNDSGDKAQLYKCVNGTLTLLSEAAFSVSTTQYYTMKVDVAGNHVIGSIDGVQKIDWTNSISQLTNGKIGIRTSSSMGKFDDVLVTQ